MSTAAGPNSKGENSLVFAFDLADTKNSYIGEPAVNLQANGSAVGHNSGGYGNVVTVVNAPEKGPGWKKVTISNRGSNFRIIQFTYTSMTADIMYCHSAVFDWGNMRGKGYYINHDGNGTGQRAFYKPGNYTAAQGASISINSSLEDGKIAGTIIHTTSHIHAFFINNSTSGVSGLNDYFYYKEYQVEANTHPTPYTSGTRLATESLVDLAGNSVIDLTNVSFNNDAQMVFDGTDDYMNVNLSLNSGNFTYETVMSVNNTTYPIFGAGYGTIGTTIQSFITSSGALINLYNPIGASGQWVYGSYSNLNGYVSVTNQLRHIIVTNNGTTWQTYVDGQLVGNVTFYQPTTGTDVGIGRIAMQSPSNISTVVKMVKVYNKALSAEEVVANFQVTRKRFNI